MNSDYARRWKRGNITGRGFDSRRLHSLKGTFRSPAGRPLFCAPPVFRLRSQVQPNSPLRSHDWPFRAPFVRGFAVRFRAPQASQGDPEVRNFEPIPRARRTKVRNVVCLVAPLNCQRSRRITQRDLTPIEIPIQLAVLAGIENREAAPAHSPGSRPYVALTYPSVGVRIDRS